MRISCLLLLLLLAPTLRAQDSLDVTFRFIPGSLFHENAFLPGDFNGWGQPYKPNTGACIQAGDESQMTYVQFDGYWFKTLRLQIGNTHQYKIQYHSDVAGNTCTWLSDPNNPTTVPPDNNSVLVVTDTLLFQLAQEVDGNGLIGTVSAGVFSTEAITGLTFTLNGVVRTDGLDFLDAATGIFRYELDRALRAGAQFRLDATDAAGRTFSAEIGELLAPIEWVSEDFTTVKPQTTLKALLTKLDGSIDPTLTEATVYRNGEGAGTLAVTNGVAEGVVDLDLGPNTITLEATIDGQVFTSEARTLFRRYHPLERRLVDVAVSGSSNAFQIDLAETGLGTVFNVAWALDAARSTTPVTGFAASSLQASGTADGPGEVYVDVVVSELCTVTGPPTPCLIPYDSLRVAVRIADDGSVREMAYEENAAWTKQAVVYEIFPLSFGPTASGTTTSPGKRFQEITDELDYLADMGFNTLWFMPIYDDQFMDQTSAGYNIVDFFHVDPKLGTNDDFKALVDRAHTLGMKVILDITPNHVSPIHPWTESLRAGGAFSPFLQTTPSNHDRGLDGQGPNLPEIWHSEGGTNLYRKYDGFGDLANLDWDDDDLQAAFLDVLAFWVQQFDIDGWRFDVYWGPWRRYGPERFGRPIRDLMKRLKPDAWLLGEIQGTGFNTEVYYTDDDFGNKVVGGLDAAYDWNFYFNGIRGTYGSLSNYNNWVLNGNFWPGPNARYFRFLENHDETRIAKLQATVPERVLPLTGMLLTIPGVPMVYQGQEVNFGNVSGDDRRVAVSWQTERNGRFAETYQRLAHARAQFPAFGTQTLQPLLTTGNVYSYVRPWLDENAVVLVNFAATPQTVTVNPSAFVQMSTTDPIPYTDLFADTTFTASGAFSVTVPAFETVLYLTHPDPDFTLPALPRLPFGAVYTAAEAAADLPQAVTLHPNYPNPFNPATTIRYDLPQAAPVRLEVFDVLGRRVALLAEGLQAAGTHTVDFEGGHLPSGLYLYRLQAGTTTQTRTMLLVK
jgi:glycosidase